MYGEAKKIKFRDLNFNCVIDENSSPVWLIITHGLGEHQGRHEYMNKMFGQYFNIFRYDLRGHGLTEGKRAYVSDFSEYALDLEAIVQYLTKEFSMKRFVLFGHSMGALITCDYIQNLAEKNIYPEKVFVKAAPFGVSGPLGPVMNLIPQGITRALANLPVSIELKGLVDLNYLSHNKQIKEEYEKDPLNATKINTKLALEIVNSGKIISSKPLRTKCPISAVIGGGDKVVSVEIFVDYFKNMEKGARLHVIDEAFHEIHNEIEKYRQPYFEFLKKELLGTLFPEGQYSL